MKKTLLLVVLGLLFFAPLAAQDLDHAPAQKAPKEQPEQPEQAEKKAYKLRKKYIDLSFASTDFTLSENPTLKSNYGAAFTTGQTFFVHKKPIAGMIRFGIDATWFDINYTNYKVDFRYEDDESELMSFHQAEIGMQVGPSITINPIAELNIHAYFRYAPSASVFYDGSLLAGFSNVFVCGGAVSYGVIGLGVEARFGGGNYSALMGGEESGGKIKGSFSGMRTRITFRF